MRRSEAYKLMYRNKLREFSEAAFEMVHRGPILRNWHIDVLADRLSMFAKGTTSRLIINLPPRSLKSFMSSVAMPAWLVGRDPCLKVLILAGSSDLAGDFRDNILRILVSDWYGSIFDDVEVTVSRRTISLSHGGSVSVRRYGENITGKGYDVIIVDDPQSPSQAKDEAKREEVAEYFHTQVATRLNSRAAGRIMVVQQRLHSGDLSGHLAEWKTLAIPAIASRDEEWTVGKGTIRRPAGEALCEARESKAELHKLLHQIGAWEFRAQYLQDPYWMDGPEQDSCRWAWQRPPEGWDRERDERMPGGYLVRPNRLRDIEASCFGGPPDPFVYVDPNREQTLEEWEAEAIAHQAELVRRAQG